MGPFFIYTGIILTLPLFFSEPESRVVLLEGSRENSSVIVTTESGSVSLETPYTQTSVVSPNEPPSAPRRVEKSDIDARYASTLEALPELPVSFLFYFEEGTARLSAQSTARTAELVELIRKREPCAVDIVGHTDTVGSSESNAELGLRRAEEVRVFLLAEKVSMTEVSVSSHGEGDLLVPTADGVDEPRNRRVEVIVR